MTGSSNPVLARPVRRPDRSLRNASTAPFIRRSRSARSYFMIRLRISPCSGLLLHDRLGSLAREDEGKVALFADRENNDRDLVVTAQRHCGRIHYPEVLRQDSIVIYCIVTFRSRIGLRVGVVYSIDARTLEQRVAFHFR